MYKILITDDEPIAVESAVQMIKRGLKQQVIIESSFSGRQAIEEAAQLRPDIVIMDIRMFGINGLEAIRKIKESNPDTVFVILSAYDYFDYAQEALSLGVAKYLVKPIHENELCDALSEIISQLNARHQERVRNLKQQEQLMMSIPVLESSFFNALSSNEDRSEEIQAIYDLIGLRAAGGYVIILRPICNAMNKDAQERILEEYRHQLKRRLECIVSISKSEVIAYLLGANSERSRVTNSANDLIATLDIFQKKMTPTLVGVGQYYNTVSDAQKSYQEARFALEVLLEEKTEDASALWYKHSPKAQALYSSMISGHRPQDVSDEKTNDTTDDIIGKAEEYIAKHYTKPIKLEDVAQAVNLSQYYFSRVFKQEKGLSFTEYLTQKRIDCAKTLLNSSQLSVKEIAYESGFQDPNYFSKIFKRITGMTPSEFKDLENPGKIKYKLQ
jgi:two-component system response regulator YesN